METIEYICYIIHYVFSFFKMKSITKSQQKLDQNVYSFHCLREKNTHFSCGKRDLNPHALRHRNLNPARLPIPSFPQLSFRSVGLITKPTPIINFTTLPCQGFCVLPTQGSISVTQNISSCRSTFIIPFISFMIFSQVLSPTPVLPSRVSPCSTRFFTIR